MFKYTNLGITTIVTGDKLKIEIPIRGLVSGFNQSPNNCEGFKVKRGKRQEFANFIAEKIIDEADCETGESLVMDLFEKAFEDIFEGNDLVDDIVKYPEDEDY